MRNKLVCTQCGGSGLKLIEDRTSITWINPITGAINRNESYYIDQDIIGKHKVICDDCEHMMNCDINDNHITNIYNQ